MTLCELLIDLKLIEREKGTSRYKRIGTWDEKQLEVLRQKKFWVCQGNIRGIKPTLTDLKLIYRIEPYVDEYTIEYSIAFRGNKEYIRFKTCSIGSAQVFYDEDECIKCYLKDVDDFIKPLQKKKEELEEKIKKLTDEIDKYAILL